MVMVPGAFVYIARQGDGELTDFCERNKVSYGKQLLSPLPIPE